VPEPRNKQVPDNSAAPQLPADNAAPHKPVWAARNDSGDTLHVCSGHRRCHVCRDHPSSHPQGIHQPRERSLESQWLIFSKSCFSLCPPVSVEFTPVRRDTWQEGLHRVLGVHGTAMSGAVDTNTGKTQVLPGLYGWFQVPRATHYPLSTSRPSCDPGWLG